MRTSLWHSMGWNLRNPTSFAPRPAWMQDLEARPEETAWAWGCCLPFCYVDLCVHDACAGQWVWAQECTCPQVLTHVCAHTCFHVHRPCRACRGTSFSCFQPLPGQACFLLSITQHKCMEDLLWARPAGLATQGGTRLTEGSHTVLLSPSVLSHAPALKAKCHHLRFPVEVPEGLREQRGTAGEMGG